jgi:hypothetical protein
MKNAVKNYSCAAKAWLAVGGLAALGLTLIAVSELPSILREWKIMRM